MKKDKKWWLKISCIGILFIVIIIIVIKSTTRILGVGEPGISKKEFENIQIGDDIYEVSTKIDNNNKWVNDWIYKKCIEEIGVENKKGLFTYTYKYYGEKNGYAIITYEADYTGGVYSTPKVIKKEKYNLK